ncbi:MAG: DinB family protein [Planctomycetales bacterium]|nr:DinB family protein [Planctomycetales bacterium]
MKAQDALRTSFNLCSMVLKSYVSDLDDADLMQRPGEGCNHLAWQLGHLISSEVNLLNMAAPGKGIELPAGFDAAHSKDVCGNDDPAAFLSKADYLEWFDKVRASSLEALASLSDEELDKPGPEHFRQFCPTVGDLFALIATHPMMHAGQFVIVRRRLGKPVLM